MSKASYKMTQHEFLSEFMARTIAQTFRAEWHKNELPGGEGWGEYLLTRNEEMKAVLRVFPTAHPADVSGPHWLSLEESNRVATTFRALGLKLLVARPAPGSIQIATLDGAKIDRIHLRKDENGVVQAGWEIDPVEFRTVVPLPDGKSWSDYKLAQEG